MFQPNKCHDATNGSASSLISSLPPGLRLNPGPGVISGASPLLDSVNPTVIICDDVPVPPTDPLVQALDEPVTVRWLAETSTGDSESFVYKSSLPPGLIMN
jgi:hypothetical protein